MVYQEKKKAGGKGGNCPGLLCLSETALKAWKPIPGAHLKGVINKHEWFQGRVL